MRAVYPYFVPPADTVHASEWQRHLDGDWTPLESWVPEWDYRTRLRLRSTVDVRVDEVRAATGLDDGTSLAWSWGWRATDSKLVNDPSSAQVVEGVNTLELEVSSARAGAGIALTRRLIVGRDRMHARPGETRWAGSALWSDEKTVRLTGHA